MVRVRSFVVVILIVAVVVASCRSEPLPTMPLTSVVDAPSGEVRCFDAAVAAEAADVTARFEIIGNVVMLVREGVCAPVDDATRLCRNLFLIAATDPLAAVGAGLDAGRLLELAEWHRWALGEGIAAAEDVDEPSVADALRALVAIDVSGDFAGEAGAAALANAAVARADRLIIEPLAAAEEACLSRPR